MELIQEKKPMASLNIYIEDGHRERLVAIAEELERRGVKDLRDNRNNISISALVRYWVGKQEDELKQSMSNTTLAVGSALAMFSKHLSDSGVDQKVIDAAFRKGLNELYKQLDNHPLGTPAPHDHADESAEKGKPE